MEITKYKLRLAVTNAYSMGLLISNFIIYLLMEMFIVSWKELIIMQYIVIIIITLYALTRNKNE